MSEITLSLEHPSLGCGEIIARYDLTEIQEKAYQQGRADQLEETKSHKWEQMLIDLGKREGRAEAIEEIYNKIDEGVCDICEHKDFDDKCYLNCRHEVENAKSWLLALKEQK